MNPAVVRKEHTNKGQELADASKACGAVSVYVNHLKDAAKFVSLSAASDKDYRDVIRIDKSYMVATNGRIMFALPLNSANSLVVPVVMPSKYVRQLVKKNKSTCAIINCSDDHIWARDPDCDTLWCDNRLHKSEQVPYTNILDKIPECKNYRPCNMAQALARDIKNEYLDDGLIFKIGDTLKVRVKALGFKTDRVVDARLLLLALQYDSPMLAEVGLHESGMLFFRYQNKATIVVVTEPWDKNTMNVTGGYA
jgi:hypothetical protein